MEPESGAYHGPWLRLHNQAAASRGSIHDDEQAQSLGFRRGFVPGTTIAMAALHAIVAHGGQEWFDGGWHDVTFAEPAYDDEEVRIVIEREHDAAPSPCALFLETKAGRRPARGHVGWAGDAPWTTAEGLQTDHRAFTDLEVGAWLPDHHFVFDASSFESSATATGLQFPWCVKGSRWGPPLAPPVALLPVTRWASSELPMGGARPPGMNGRMQVQYRRPVFLDREYLARTRLVATYASARAWARTIEFHLWEPGIPDEAAHGRHTIKWWPPRD